MVFLKSKNFFIWASLLIAFGVALFQTLSNSLGLLIFLALFGVLLAYAAFRDMAMPVLLFFLPWSPLMKVTFESFSFYTLGLVLVCFVSVLKKKFSFKRYQIVCGILIVFLTLLSKFIDGSWIAFDYIAFIMLIVLFYRQGIMGTKEFSWQGIIGFFKKLFKGRKKKAVDDNG